MATSRYGGPRAGAVMVMISAVCVALIVGPGQAFADPCPTSTKPTTEPTTTEPTTTVPTTTEPTTTVPTTTEPPIDSSILIPRNFPSPNVAPSPSFKLNSFTTCETDTPSVTSQTRPSTPVIAIPSQPSPTYVTTTPSVGRDDDPPPPPTNNAWIPLVVLCALAVAAGLAARAWRHRGGKFLKAHVTVASHRGVPVPFDVRHADGTGRDHILSVVPSVKSHSTTVEEVH